MINQLEVRTPSGELLTLSLSDVSNGYIIQDIDGLGPVKANIVSSSFAGMDGSQYQAARREKRNILLKLGFEPDYVTNSVQSLRSRLYEIFMPKSQINMRFYLDDDLVVSIDGMVETCEPTMFTREPEVSISILCFNPDFFEIDSVSIDGSTVSSTTEFTIQYSGSVNTGILLTLNVNRTISDFTIYHRPPDGTLRSFDFSASLQASDVVKISTVARDKYVTLTRAGSVSSVLYAKAPTSDWLELQKGVNNLRVYAEGAAIPFTITYLNRYGAI